MSNIFNIPPWLNFVIILAVLIVFVAIIAALKIVYSLIADKTGEHRKEKIYWIILMIVIIVAVLSVPIFLYFDSVRH